MAELPQAPDSDSKDVAWLRSEIVKLFETATRVAEPDIPSCTKLAEILFKMLPKGDGKAATAAVKKLDEHRQRVLEGGAPKVG